LPKVAYFTANKPKKPNFYRAMHYIVQRRGIAIATMSSVRPSVCNVGESAPHRFIRLEILETNYTDN